jgi:hypothetical protein
MNNIRKLTPFLPALLVLLFTAGCGGTTAPAAGVPESPSPNASSGAQGTAAPSAATPPGGSGKGGTGLDIQVTQLSVASNFEIRGQLMVTNTGTANVQDLAFTYIQLRLPGGEPVFEAAAPSIQGGVMDTKPMAGLAPGTSRPYGFSAAPGTILKPVAQGDEVTGVLTLSVDGRPLEVIFPLAKVTPQRIP